MTIHLGRYELHDVLGTGGFATVYRATDPSLETVVAVKVLADNWSHDPEVRRRFRAEAVLLRRVQASGAIHGLVEVHDIDEDDAGRPFYVMGYADRGTLATRSRGRAWPAADVVPVIDALAETVGALHDNRIVHRDLKPSNLLLRGDGRANTRGPGTLVAWDERLLVSDLGLAKDLQREATSMSFGGGTHCYLAPEQLDPRAAVDHRADVRAATAIVTQLLTGSPRLSLAEAASHGVGPGLFDVLERGLADDPRERFESMAQWRLNLIAAIDRNTPPAPQPSPERAGPGPAVRALQQPAGLVTVDRPASRSARRPVLLGAVLGALLAVIALAWVAVRLVTSDGIVGPGEVVVGKTVRFRAPGAADQAVTWTGPDGEVVRDQDLSVRAIVPGTLHIELLVGDDRTTRTVEALPSPLGPRVNGPRQARLGEAIELQAGTDGGAAYWLDPGGRRVEGATLRLTPTAPGTLSVALIVRGSDGIERGTRHEIEVAS